MPIQSKENNLSAWLFLAGVVLAVVIGISASSLLPFEELKSYSKEIYTILVFLGILVGYFTQVTGKESQTFLIAGTIIVIVSRFGMESVTSSLIGIGLGDTVSSTFGALLALFVPATIVVALKTVFSVSKV
jgi:anaerobic C4-dicarboxylate transporter